MLGEGKLMHRIRGTLECLRFVVLSTTCLAAVSVSNIANAQKNPSDMDAVRAANTAFYTALSARNIPALQKIWSSDADIQNIGPRNKVLDVGWDAQNKATEAVYGAVPELQVSMPEPTIKVNGDTAWVSGIEHAQRKTKAGETVNGTNLGTSIFAKQGGDWRMVYHHASAIPR